MILMSKLNRTRQVYTYKKMLSTLLHPNNNFNKIHLQITINRSLTKIYFLTRLHIRIDTHDVTGITLLLLNMTIMNKDIDNRRVANLIVTYYNLI